MVYYSVYTIDSDLFPYLRLDKASTNCRKGVTVKCGNVCRKPENCKLKPGGAQYKSLLARKREELKNQRRSVDKVSQIGDTKNVKSRGKAMELPKLQGSSEREIAWAEKIRKEKLEEFNRVLKSDKQSLENLLKEDPQNEGRVKRLESFVRKGEEAINFSRQITDASWWIKRAKSDRYEAFSQSNIR